MKGLNLSTSINIISKLHHELSKKKFQKCFKVFAKVIGIYLCKMQVLISGLRQNTWFVKIANISTLLKTNHNNINLY